MLKSGECFLLFVLVACEPQVQKPNSKSWIQRVVEPVISEVCLKGHSYYHYGGSSHSGIAPRLTDEGKPFKCEVKK